MADTLYIPTNGFFFGLALIAAIGPQSCFVTRQGLSGEHGMAVAHLCSACGVALIALSVTMMANLADVMPRIEPALRMGGALFVAGYGLRNLHGAIFTGAPVVCTGQLQAPRAFGPTLTTCLALTFLNPHLAVDMVLLGGIATTHADPALFGLGAIAASITFFFGLVLGARALRPIFASPRAIRRLDAGWAA